MCFYLDSFDAAIQKVQFDRRQMPAIYNDQRLFEQPIPRAEYSIDEIDVGAQDDLQSTFFDSNANVSEIEVKPVIDVLDMAAIENIFNFDAEPAVQYDVNQIDPMTIGNVANLSIVDGSSNNEFEKNVNSNDGLPDSSSTAGSFGSEFEHESTRIDANKKAEKSAQDVMVRDYLSGVNVAETQPNEAARKIAENVEQLVLHGEKVTCGDVEYISIPGQILKPIMDEPAYTVKTTDMLCGKKAFKQYVRLCIAHNL